MKVLNERKKECLQTLYREKMFVEAIFRESIDGEEYLTWFSVQGEKGEDVKTSALEIDKIHLKFWEECIDKTYKPIDKKPEAFFIYPEVFERIRELDEK